MDLRPYRLTQKQLNMGLELIKNGSLFYQPFILNDDLEVGEGLNFCNQYEGTKHIHDFNVYAHGYDFGNRKLASDKDYFRKCNDEYRSIYDFITNKIIKLVNEPISNLEFAEIGCNTGLSLFNLAAAGAKKCIGYDWNDMTMVFGWLNNILKTDVKFVQGTWDNLYHQFSTEDLPEVDVMINTIYTNHQFDPIQFISYICDRARKGVFLWILMSESDRCVIEYPPSPPHHILDTERPFPLYFNNAVCISRTLLNITIERLGFELIEISPDIPSEKWNYFFKRFKMFYAKRINNTKSAYYKNKNDVKNNDDIRKSIFKKFKQALNLN